eukprot:284819211_4
MTSIAATGIAQEIPLERLACGRYFWKISEGTTGKLNLAYSTQLLSIVLIASLLGGAKLQKSTPMLRTDPNSSTPDIKRHFANAALSGPMTRVKIASEMWRSSRLGKRMHEQKASLRFLTILFLRPYADGSHTILAALLCLLRIPVLNEFLVFISFPATELGLGSGSTWWKFYIANQAMSQGKTKRRLMKKSSAIKTITKGIFSANRQPIRSRYLQEAHKYRQRKGLCHFNAIRWPNRQQNVSPTCSVFYLVPIFTGNMQVPQIFRRTLSPNNSAAVFINQCSVRRIFEIVRGVNFESFTAWQEAGSGTLLLTEAHEILMNAQITRPTKVCALFLSRSRRLQHSRRIWTRCSVRRQRRRILWKAARQKATGYQLRSVTKPHQTASRLCQLPSLKVKLPISSWTCRLPWQRVPMKKTLPKKLTATGQRPRCLVPSPILWKCMNCRRPSMSSCLLNLPSPSGRNEAWE